MKFKKFMKDLFTKRLLVKALALVFTVLVVLVMNSII